MELPKFNPKKFRDDLAKDLKNLRKTDPEIALEVLNSEKNTTRFQVAEDVNSEKRPERVEFINKLRNSIKEGSLKEYNKYRHSGMSLLNKSYKEGDLIKILNFSQEELREIARKFLIDQKSFSHGSPREGEMNFVQGFLGEIGYKDTEKNKENDLFILGEMIKKFAQEEKDSREGNIPEKYSWEIEDIYNFGTEIYDTFMTPETALILLENDNDYYSENLDFAEGENIKKDVSKKDLIEEIKKHPNAKIKVKEGLNNRFNDTFIFS